MEHGLVYDVPPPTAGGGEGMSRGAEGRLLPGLLSVWQSRGVVPRS